MVIVNDMNVVFYDFIFMIEFSRVLFFDCKIFSFMMVLCVEFLIFEFDLNKIDIWVKNGIVSLDVFFCIYFVFFVVCSVEIN